MMRVSQNWIDRSIGYFSPRSALDRLRARAALAVVSRHFEAATPGRRTNTWHKPGTDANAAIGPALASLRNNARDLVRNNPYAESALATIVDHCVSWGITAKARPTNAKTIATWKAWAETTACDADGRDNFYGLQKLVMRTVAQDGECLVRRRLRQLNDGLPLPIQIQVLDADFLDTSKDSLATAIPGGGVTIQGVEFDAIGRRVAYWLFPRHPGSSLGVNASVRVPADGVLHLFDRKRPGQVRAPSWFAPILLRARDFDEFEDATLMKQKIAACLAVITSDPDGSASALGTADDTTTPPIDALEPGGILNIQPGRSIDVVQPPSASDYAEYSKTQLRAFATGIGVTYEDLTGDYGGMPFSAARMSRLRHESRIRNWRYNLIIPQFCDPCFAWAMEVATILGLATEGTKAEWTPAPLPMVDPATEGLAAMRNIRSGLTSWSDTVRERGFDPDDLRGEIQRDFEKLDGAGIWLDSDPRYLTQAGQLQGRAKAETDPTGPPAKTPQEEAAAQ